MDIAQSMNHFFLSISTFLNVVWGRVLPSQSSDGSPPFDLESQSLESPAQLQSQAPQPHSAMETELRSQARRPHSAMETELTELRSQAPQPHSAMETELRSQARRPHSAMETELTELRSQAPQPHSAMETELQSPPPAQQTPPPAINPQQINMVIVGQISLQWPNVALQFCLQSAIQIALQYETTQHPKLPVSFYLRSLFILLTFTSLFASHLIRNKSPDISRVLEKAATFLAATVFFTTMATPFTLARK